MNRVVFLLEESSMRIFLEGLLPRLIPGLAFICVTHEGKQDLEKSIPRKLRAWREPGVRFVVVRDNDGSECRILKARLRDLCREAGRDDTVVRIACQELEAWYFGDVAALARAYGRPDLESLPRKKKYRDSDGIRKPSKELESIIPEFQKISGARLMGKEISKSMNRSHSYQVFLGGVLRIAESFSQIP